MNELILTYVAILAPSVTTIVGIIMTGLYAVKKIREIVKEIKGDNYQKSLKESNEKLKQVDEELKTQLSELVKENREKSKEIRLLIDEIHKIEGYSDYELDKKV